MTDEGQPYRPNPVLLRIFGPFAWRPRLIGGLGMGLAAFLAMCLFVPTSDWSFRAVVFWDVSCLWFAARVLSEFRGEEGSDIKARVAAQDEGQGLILLVVVIASVFSLTVVGFELSLAKGSQGWIKALRVGSAVATVALSWFTVQLVFALHYAHEYYAPDKATPKDDILGGLAFPGDQAPDYWDFLHFAVVIGVACQTADIAFTSQSLRRIGTAHGMVAFVFNTVILALTINLAAGLF